MGMCGPEDPLFTPLLPLARVPFQVKESVHKTPFGNLEILVSTASIFTQILAHKPPNLEIFCSQAPLFRGKRQFASPALRKSGPHTPTLKKVECPPLGNKPIRYNFYFVKDLLSFRSQLNIRNAVKQDKGWYQCQMRYKQGSNLQTLMETADVTIEQYLPALNYPECSIGPSTVLVHGDLATFNCIVGDANPPVNLTLTLTRTDGSEHWIGDARLPLQKIMPYLLVI